MWSDLACAGYDMTTSIVNNNNLRQRHFFAIATSRAQSKQKHTVGKREQCSQTRKYNIDA